ncbi:hypothetical protein BFJ68_g17796 [Fusarium oxysporum]|uniref:Uncharacterized protein n=1 Tax=Fusarium oxysporum TaxID=5507 RepID=A0A420NH35_FUSOX|nr:hypothetical protein FOMA001_g19778 [Fusarium oxysporum f. sp. matthiolae]RKK74025.1 hypothetical protein BFJ71_g17328 [Fusarium oxysporum]RKK79585.1 hypothetical protein BFJ68_g17796 [Fusarium oxysporum]
MTLPTARTRILGLPCGAVIVCGEEYAAITCSGQCYTYMGPYGGGWGYIGRTSVLAISWNSHATLDNSGRRFSKRVNREERWMNDCSANCLR